MSSLQRNEPFLQLGTTGEGKRPFILSGTDFERHKVISGITGAGKSFFLASIFILLFRLGITVLMIDPNGDLAKLILSLLASSDYFTDPRAFSRLWYVDFKRAEKDYAIAFNVLNQPYEAHTTANNLLESMHRAFPVSGTTTSLDNVILAASLVLIENSLPISELPRLILESQFRDRLLHHVSDPLVVQFFKSKFGDKVNSNLVDSTMRRSFLLTFSPVLRNTLGQRENMLNMRHILDIGISCIFNLGGLDDQSKRLLGGALLVNIEQAFLSRADIDPHVRKPAHVIIDEFPVFSSHSEQSFAVILEQVRKYKGTLYLAHQTQSQLSSGMAGSLQNAVSINMRAGAHTDSSVLVQQFYRPLVEQPDSLVDSFLRFAGVLPGKERSLFADVENTNQAKYLFETLQRQEAIVTLNGVSTFIKTNTIPSVNVDPGKLVEIENTYATKLLTPLSQIEREQTRSNMVLLSSPPATIKRRTYEPSPTQSKPVTFITGNLEQDIQAALMHFHYLTLDQIIKLLGKKEGNKNYLRKKLTDMSSTVLITLLPRVTGGKPLQVFHLSANSEKKQMFLEHTLDVNEVLIAGVLLPTVQPSLTLIDIRHERTLKALLNTCPCIPDGLLIYQTKEGELVHIAVEIDRATENRERIAEKYTSSTVWIETMGIEAVTLAFIVTTDDKKRVSSLCDIAGEEVTDLADILLFTAVASGTIAPSLFTSPVFKALDGSSHALIEQPF